MAFLILIKKEQVQSLVDPDQVEVPLKGAPLCQQNKTT